MKGTIWAIAAVLLFGALIPFECAGQTAPSHQGSPSSAAPVAVPSASGPATSTAPAPSSTPNAANPLSSTDCDSGPCPAPTPHITIATPAPAPAPWPWQDRIGWAANVLLALMAYVAIVMALSLLRKIERQSRYAEAAAEAAAQSAKTVLQYAEAHARAERPWILVTAEPAPGTPDAFNVVATNRGRGPAKIVSLDEGITTAKDDGDLPADPIYKAAESRAPLSSMILLPGESTVIRSFRRDDVQSVCTTQEQLHRVETWEDKIYLYGKVTYIDLQSPDEKLTYDSAWCCWYIHGRQKSGLVPTGLAPYNRHS